MNYTNRLYKILRTTLLILLIIILFLFVYSAFAIKKEAKVHYIENLHGKMLATTIPPFGIYIKEKYQNEGDGPGTILAHERIHWLQYQELGLWTFYGKYLVGFIQHGRLYNELEIDARKRSS